MKKIIVLTLALLLIMATLAACSNTPSTDPSTSNPSDTTVADATEPSTDDSSDTTDPSTTTPSEDKIPSSFRSLPSSENLLDVYRKEVEYRLASERYFTLEEDNFLESKGYNAGYRCIQEFTYYGELHTYYYPVVYQVDDDEIVIAYSRDGHLSFEGEYEVTKNFWQVYGSPSVHTSQLDDEEAEIFSAPKGALVYNSTSGDVSFWEFGKNVSTCTVPAGSVYAGASDWEGYIFRNNSKVYAVSTEGARLIAEDVSVVILADYYAGSDDWSQPLFLMKDGSLKVYCSWYGDREAPAHDPCHLQDVRYEGGYNAAP